MILNNFKQTGICAALAFVAALPAGHVTANPDITVVDVFGTPNRWIEVNRIQAEEMIKYFENQHRYPSSSPGGGAGFNNNNNNADETEDETPVVDGGTITVIGTPIQPRPADPRQWEAWEREQQARNQQEAERYASRLAEERRLARGRCMHAAEQWKAKCDEDSERLHTDDLVSCGGIANGFSGGIELSIGVVTITGGLSAAEKVEQCSRVVDSGYRERLSFCTRNGGELKNQCDELHGY